MFHEMDDGILGRKVLRIIELTPPEKGVQIICYSPEGLAMTREVIKIEP